MIIIGSSWKLQLVIVLRRMKLWIFFFLTGCVLAIIATTWRSPRKKYVSSSENKKTKRSITDFNRILKHVAGYTNTKLRGYGCWCENPRQRSKVIPRDSIDLCCKHQIKCLKNSGCNTNTDYKYLLRRNKNAVCRTKYKYVTKRKWVRKFGRRVLKNVRVRVVDKCARKICSCDVSAAKCFDKHTYKRKNKNFNRRKCSVQRRPGGAHKTPKMPNTQFNRIMNHVVGYTSAKLRGYGCFCGNPNQGSRVRARDDIDLCCRDRIHCLKNSGCNKNTIYKYLLRRNKSVVCRTKYKYVTKRKWVRKSGRRILKNVRVRVVDKCASKICNCDVGAAKCFAKYTYKPKIKNFDRRKCSIYRRPGVAHKVPKKPNTQFNRITNHVAGYTSAKLRGYGCFCGNPNQGSRVRARDDIDLCCRDRINCLKNSGCNTNTIYKYLLRRNKSVVCRTKYKYVTKRKWVRKSGRWGRKGGRVLKNVRVRVVDKCARKVCKCDVGAAKCFAKYTYKPKYKNFNRRKCSVRRHKNPC